MQAQDYLPFFQNLLLQYYQFTLENSAYAICLAVSVWLLTTLFYSIRIGFLNRRNKINVKALLDTQNDLATAQQQIQQLQEELAANNEQLEHIKTEAEQQTQRATSLQSRISRLDSQLAESIASLTTNADLSEQFSPNANGLETEDLWQRYSAINKQLSTNLATERKSHSELQQAFTAEIAKLAEKDKQLQLMQVHVDSQNQQLAQLELIVAEHKTLLAQQQESAQQRLSETEAKHQNDLARINALEQQTLELTQAKQQAPIQEQINATSAVITKPEEVKVVETKIVEPQAVAVEPEPQYIYIKPAILPVQEPTISEVAAPKPAIVIAEAPKKQPVKTPEKATGGVAGKLKNFFSNAKQRIDKLDGKLENNPTPPAEEPAQLDEPQAAAIEAPISPAEISNANYQTESTATEVSPAADLSHAFAATTTEPIQEIPAEIQQPSAKEITTDTDKQATSKLKNLFGKFKRK